MQTWQLQHGGAGTCALAPAFAFQNWHSAIELKRYFHRFMRFMEDPKVQAAHDRAWRITHA